MDNSGQDPDSYGSQLTQLVVLQAGFAATIDDVDPSRPLPWCGDWTVADLVEHLTYIHHWAAAMARSEDYPDQPDPGEQRTRAALRTRYEAAAAELRATLAALDPDAPARTLVDGGTVAFWSRRQLHETLIHLWDLQTAAGRPLTADPRLWADTVDEAATVMHPRQLRLGRAAPAPLRLVFVAADVDARWELPYAPGAADARTTVIGPAEALALLVWGRTRLDDAALEVDGDAAALQRVLNDHFVP